MTYVYAQTHRVSFFFLWRYVPTRVMASTFTSFLDRTQRRTTVGRAPPDKWSARRTVLYLTTHDSQNRHPCLQRVSNLQSQKVSGRRPTSYTRGHLERLVSLLHKLNIQLYFEMGARGGAVGWGTALQDGRSRVRFPVSLEFFSDVIIPAALWSWGWLSLWQKWVSGIFPGG